MILVAGGTGTLGTAVVRLLTVHGDTVRILTRDQHRADDLRAAGVDVVVGDIRDPARVADAARGCRTVVSAVHGFTGGRGSGPAAIDLDGNRALIGAAVEAGVDHLILVSVYGAGPGHPMSLHRMKYAAEQVLIGSNLRWTVIRPVPFLETWTDIIGTHLADQGKAIVFGRGDNPINFVSLHDVAATIHDAVHDRARTAQLLDVTGPDNMTFNDIAKRLIEASKTPARLTHIPLAVMRLMAVLAKPFAPALARKAQAAVVMNTVDMAVNRVAPTANRSTDGNQAPSDLAATASSPSQDVGPASS